MLPSWRAMSERLALLLLLGATLMTSGCIDDDIVEPGGTAEVTVMTRNLYLGADIFRLATSADPIPLTVAQIWGTVQFNNFPARAGALAAEIERHAPDLIGLQEVSLYRLQDPSDYNLQTGVNNSLASDTALDYLAILLDSLDARGLEYEVVATVENADVELPGARSPTEFFDVRLTDRDVILARAGVGILGGSGMNFSTVASIPVGALSVDFLRGYTWVTATVDDVSFLFVNAHLEVASSLDPRLETAQAAQAYELTSAFGRSSPVVMVGDFNSVPGAASYNILTASFTDAWTGGNGFTCCQPEVLLQAGTLDERIDLILYRGVIDMVSPAEIVGDDAADRTAGGLWPSDHAGVVATLQIRD